MDTAAQASFLSSLPTMRAREELIAAVGAAGSGRAGDAHRAAVAEIELLIADGDRAARTGAVNAALAAFEQARAELYRLVFPAFDVGQYLLSDRPALTVSVDIERQLLAAATQLVEAVRPSIGSVRPPTWSVVERAPDDALAAYFALGVREEKPAEELLQLASEHAVALVAAGRPEAGLRVLDAALSSADGGADAGLTAAAQLNRAGALLQAGQPEKAVEAARAAADGFAEAKDVAGVGQAAHLEAIGALQSGDHATADEAFNRAAGMVGRLGGDSAGGGPAGGGPAGGGPAGGGPAGGDAAAHLNADAAGAVALTVMSAPISGASAAAVRGLAPRWSASVSRDPAALAPLRNRDATVLTYRLTGRGDGWGTMALVDPLMRAEQVKPWRLGVTAGVGVVELELSNAKPLAVDDVVTALYRPRLDATTGPALRWSMGDTSATSLYFLHIYGYVLPLKIGDAYFQSKLYAKAEEHYLQAAAYSYLNPTIEATVVWVRLARTAVAWGDSLYRDEDLAGATTQYGKLTTVTGTAPSSPLYTTASLATPAGVATTLLANLSVRPLPSVDWEIALAILQAYGQLQQLAAGFDFYGLLLAPIHTFEYLQNVAEGFAREAIQAESQYVNFAVRQQSDEATRRELEAAKATADAEADARRQLWLSAQSDEKAAKDAADLATKRRDDAQHQRDDYVNVSASDLWARVAAQALSGGQDAYVAEITELANRLDRGETISGPGPKLAAAQALAAGRRTQAYELQKMQDTIDELTQNITVAGDEYAAAKGRTIAAELQYQAALQRAQLAAASLQAFDSNLFGPEQWATMAAVMRDLAQGYLFRGIRLAKLMERAYNFEHDATLHIIKNEYGIGLANPTTGASTTVLGGDLLLSDVLSFSYAAITSRTRKSCRIKDVLSIAAMFPAQFDVFRRTGRLTFTTDLYEFDRLHPGYYGQRLAAVELELVGLLPEAGVQGTLTAGGVTSFRRADGGTASRVQVIDTLALSAYEARTDGLLYTVDTGVKGLFQGFGVGASWELHLPRRSNDLDLRRLFDVRLVLYYTAEYDAGLAASVLAAPVRADELAWVRDFGMRYDFPDSWYGFYKAGTVTATLERLRLPANQQNFLTRRVHVRVVTRDGVSAQGITVAVTAPNGATGTAATDADGQVSTENAALSTVAGHDPVGGWTIQVVGGDPLVDGAAVAFSRVYNIQLGFDYSFDYVPEA